MNAQRDRCLGLILLLLATVGGPVFPSHAEEKSVPEPLPLPTEIPTDPLPPGAVMRLGSTPSWQPGDLIHAVAYSHDGKRIASASFGEDSVRIWDANSGEVLHRVPLTDVRELALSDDGKMLAAIGRDKFGEGPGVWIWKEKTEKPLELVVKTDEARCLLFQGKMLWVGHADRITAWNLDPLKQREGHKFEKPTRVNALAISRDLSPHLAAATSNGVLLINMSGNQVDSVPTPSNESATSVAFSLGGRMVAVGTEDGGVCAWSILNGKLKKRFSSRPHQIGVTSIAYSGNKNELISVCHGGEIVRCDATSGDKISRILAAGAPPVAAEAITTPALVLSDDGQRLAGRFGLKSKEINPYLHVWDTTNGQELSTLPGLKGLERKLLGPVGAIQKMAFPSDGSLVSLSTMGELTLWNTKIGAVIRRELLPRENLNKAAISAAGRVAFFDEELDLIDIDLKTGKRFPRYSLSRWVYGTAFSREPNLFVTGYSGRLGLWSVKEKTVNEVDVSLKRVSNLTFSGDGQRLLLTDEERVQVWNVATKSKIRDLKNVRADGPIALSAHGQFAAVWSTKGRLHFFDAQTGEEFPSSNPTLKVANDLVFTPDSRCLVVATEDGARFFEPLTGNESRGQLEGGQGALTSLAINRDGTLLATGGADGTVLLWDIRRVLRNGLASHEERMPLLPEQREKLWIELASTDSASGFASTSAFFDGGKGSITFLRDRLLSHQTPVGDAQQQRLLKQLADPDYKERAKAFVALKKLGRAAEPMLREAFRTEKDEIMHLRLRAFLSELESDGIVTAKDDRVREMRVVQILGLMDTPFARQLLSDLAEKGASEQIRKDATETLQRLKGLAQKD